MPTTAGVPSNGDAVDGFGWLYADGHDDDDDRHERLYVSNDESVRGRNDGRFSRFWW